jgi:Raf kinase inhibitor-like YbhB/YbcL family protein
MLQNLPDFVGHALREQRAGLEKTVYQRVPLRGGQASIRVTSLAFIDHGPMPVLYTADGEGLSPPLQWSGLPPATRSVVLIVEDADSPTPQPLVHAIAVGLSPEDNFLREGALNDEKHATACAPHAHLGRNSYLQTGWLPPDPPPGHGVHRYTFQVFALENGGAMPETPGRDALVDVLQNHAIASGCLTGTYERHDTSVRAAEPAGVRPA